MKKSVTLKDVAREAGVSSSTVSRALNKNTKNMINADLVLEIEAVASRMQYSTNLIARSLQNGKTYTVGIIVRDIINPIFGELADEIIECLSKSDYKAIIIFAKSNSCEYIESMAAKQVDGLIFTNAYINDLGVEYCIENNIPCVTVGRTTQHNLISQICVDNDSGMQLIIKHLVDLGHRDIAFIAGPESISNGHERKEKFAYWMQHYNANFNDQAIIQASSFNRTCGYSSIQKLFYDGASFTAVVAANDLLAVGVLDYLTQYDIRCPQDLSVVGFNAMLFSDVLSTPLTSVFVDRKIIAQKAVSFLLENLNDKDQVSQEYLAAATLIVRKSTSSPRIFKIK